LNGSSTTPQQEEQVRKHLRLAALVIAACGLATAAQATPTLQIEVFDGATLLATSPVTAGGTVTLTTSDASFSSIVVSAQGVPLIPSPDLGVVNVSVSSYGAAKLHILVTQVGLSAIPYPTSAAITSTYNALIGGPGPLTASLYTDAGDAAFAKTTLQGKHTFNFGNGTAQSFSASTTLGAYSGPFSETVAFDETFSAGAQDLQATLQFAVPEAASISLFGSGLILIGLMRRRREEAPAKAAR
jgi:hypothetical protein